MFLLRNRIKFNKATTANNNNNKKRRNETKDERKRKKALFIIYFCARVYNSIADEKLDDMQDVRANICWSADTKTMWAPPRFHCVYVYIWIGRKKKRSIYCSFRVVRLRMYLVLSPLDWWIAKCFCDGMKASHSVYKHAHAQWYRRRPEWSRERMRERERHGERKNDEKWQLDGEHNNKEEYNRTLAYISIDIRSIDP